MEQDEGETVAFGEDGDPRVVRQFLDFIQPIDQCVSVDKQLSGGFRDVQRILKKFVDGCQCLLIKIIRRSAIKDLTDKHLAKRHGKLIDQTPDTQ